MKYKLLTLTLLIFTSVLLTACTKDPITSQTRDSSTPAPTPTIDTETSNQKIKKEEIFATVEKSTDLTDAQPVSLRRKVDDIYFNDEGIGYLVRLTKNDAKLTQLEESVDEALKALKLTKKEYSPKSDNSPVVKYIKYTAGGLECTLEIRYVSKITESDERDFTFGCL
jgi:hypothetical protein